MHRAEPVYEHQVSSGLSQCQNQNIVEYAFGNGGHMCSYIWVEVNLIMKIYDQTQQGIFSCAVADIPIVPLLL